MVPATATEAAEAAAAAAELMAEAAALLPKHGGQQVVHVDAPVTTISTLLASLLYLLICPACTAH